MPPKTKPTKNKSYAGSSNLSKGDVPRFEIDVEKIPSNQRRTLDLSLDGITLYYWFVILVCAIRSFSNLKNIFLGSIPVVSADNIQSNDNFFLVTLKYFDCETEVVIGLHDFYLHGVRCFGRWFYPRASVCTIKGGTQASFYAKYPETMEYEVGLEVLRNSVRSLNHNDPSHWANAYHNLALNLAESIRFHSIMLKVLQEGRELLDKVDEWIVNNWGVMSKMWKLLCRYDKWNPEESVCKVVDAGVARLMLAIVIDVKLLPTEITKLDKKNTVVHPSVK